MGFSCWGKGMITDYHAKYFAYELTKRCASDSLEKLSSTLSNAQVDLNPHQIEAALFAFRSPLSKGAILADEVGLGKTIEAGLVLSQKWAERKRKILAEEIVANFPKESERIAAQFNSRGILSSGMHIKAQMDFSIGIKKKLDQEYESLKREIEDILVEVLNKTSLQSAGNEFNEEERRLEDAKNRCIAVYPRLNDLPKSREVRIFREMRLTRDFSVADK